MIVVEGPDGSGKTTLCKEICETFSLGMGTRAIENRDEIYKTARQDTWDAMCFELRCTEITPLVWDRIGPVSDPIYSRFSIPHERKCRFTSDELEVFHKFVTCLGLLIMCLPPLSVVIDNVDQGHQLGGVRERTRGIWDAYYQARGLAHIVYDYTHARSPNSVLTVVESYLNHRKERECFTSSTPAT